MRLEITPDSQKIIVELDDDLIAEVMEDIETDDRDTAVSYILDEKCAMLPLGSAGWAYTDEPATCEIGVL